MGNPRLYTMTTATKPPQEQKENDMTTQDFNKLPRNDDGDLVHIDDIIGLLTEKQIEELSDDDWQRYDEAINMEYC